MKFLQPLLFLIVLIPVMANAAKPVVPADELVLGTFTLQGGSDSAVNYAAPKTDRYKVHVLVPKTGTLTNALYRVYPKGKRPGSTDCVADAQYPCVEVTVDQTQYANQWVQLMLASDAETRWDFVKNKGTVTAVTDNLGTAERLNLTALVRFEPPFYIGKTYQGGIIFYLNKSGQHGLIAAPTDQSKGIRWYNGTDETGATATAVGTGLANTNKIIKAQGTGSYAAKLCADLVLDGYSDWYLPSKDELNLMYTNIGNGAAAPLTNVGGFASAYYWSSSETDYDDAWYQPFDAGLQYYNPSKDSALTVRAVRAF